MDWGKIKCISMPFVSVLVSVFDFLNKDLGLNSSSFKMKDFTRVTCPMVVILLQNC